MTYNVTAVQTERVQTVDCADLAVDIRQAWDIAMCQLMADEQAMERTVVRRKSPPVWTARCKSGYQYQTVGGWKTCSRVTRRGELMCEECKEAQAVSSDEQTVWTLGRLSPVVRVWARFVLGGIR